ncbi:hypothetical protein [Nocardia higoensis]|uniref:hypothetical protein n=1 Tax=Nocardia higoensis TaxID=228599 RepID=UPI0002D99030|nr:hypothetical protein [Nocardia higoensis]
MTYALPDKYRRANQWLEGAFGAPGNENASGIGIVALACIDAGDTETEFTARLLSSPYGEMLQERKEFQRAPHKLDALLAKQWEFAEDIYRPGSAAEIRDRARCLYWRVLTWGEWSSGKRGNNVRVAALSLVSLAAERGAYSFDCSARFLSGLAGFTKPETASAALKAVADTGLIELSGEGRQIRKVSIDLDWQLALTGTNKLLRNSLFVPNSATGAEHDVFSSARNALGPVSGWVWVYLTVTGPAVPKDIAAGLGITRVRTVGDSITKLFENGLVVRFEDGRIDALDVDLDRVAESLGVLGYKERLKQGYAVEQARNRLARDEWAAEQASERLRAAVEYEQGFAEGERSARDEWTAWFASLDYSRVSDPDPFRATTTGGVPSGVTDS